MDTSEIIRACLERGILVSPEDIEKIQSGLSIEDFVAARNSKPAEAAQENEAPKSSRITHRIQKPAAKQTITPSDITERTKEKYEAIKGLLLSKTSAISIANAKDSRTPVALIGVVRRPSASLFLLEDTTGEIEVQCSQPVSLDEGDVICVRGPVSGGRLQCKDVLLPDVPLIRPLGRIDAKLLLTKNAKEHGCDVVISETELDTDAKNIVLSDSPSLVNLYKDGSKVVVLFYRSAQELARQTAISMLKKRCLALPKPQTESCVIEPVPDVLWISGPGGSWVDIYKGVTIVHTGGRSAVVDLSSMETKLV